MNRWGDTSNPATVGRPSYRDACGCFDQTRPHPRARVGFHAECQDTSAAGWQHLLELVDEAAADGREEFRPLVELSPEERRQIVTLPPSIAQLTAVKRFVLYGSNLVRIPPEIGAMTSLEEFTPYTSYRLHWFPYEITRCSKLAGSTVSTRALFGNYKLRPPFPQLLPPQDAVADLNLAGIDPRRWGRQPFAVAVSATGRSSRVDSSRCGSPCAWLPTSCPSWSTPARQHALLLFPAEPITTCRTRTQAAMSTSPRPNGTDPPGLVSAIIWG